MCLGLLKKTYNDLFVEYSFAEDQHLKSEQSFHLMWKDCLYLQRIVCDRGVLFGAYPQIHKVPQSNEKNLLARTKESHEL